MSSEGFSGSYAREDVTFLLKIVQQEVMSVAEKEALIQSGMRHYSEMIGPEHAPSEAYLAAFRAAVNDNGDRLAADIRRLAAHIARTHTGEICLVSLARAGTPIGVLLRRALTREHGRRVRHASVSIIAGRGIDTRALDTIRGAWGVEDRSIVFVDGWTGKGVIARELRRAVADYNATRGATLSPTLHVVADLCGHTPAAATSSDYLIPSCLLGAVVSGLVSRSILSDSVIGPADYHGCRFYDDLAPFDRSRSFVDDVSARMERPREVPGALPERDLPAEAARAAEAVERWQRNAGLSSANLVKPGIGEATRVLLRRVPDRLVVRDPEDPQVRATLLLAREKGVHVTVDPELPWAALASIREQP
jgi:hypothetical protein